MSKCWKSHFIRVKQFHNEALLSINRLKQRQWGDFWRSPKFENWPKEFPCSRCCRRFFLCVGPIGCHPPQRKIPKWEAPEDCFNWGQIIWRLGHRDLTLVIGVRCDDFGVSPFRHRKRAKFPSQWRSWFEMMLGFDVGHQPIMKSWFFLQGG